MSLKADDLPEMRMYYEGALVNVVYAFILLGLAAVGLTLYKLVSSKTTQREKHLLLVGWAVVPPLWFVIEYFFIFMPYGVENSFKYFDYAQSVASKLWGAVSALTAMVIYKDNEKKKQEVPNSEKPLGKQAVGESHNTEDKPE